MRKQLSLLTLLFFLGSLPPAFSADPESSKVQEEESAEDILTQNFDDVFTFPEETEISSSEIEISQEKIEEPEIKAPEIETPQEKTETISQKNMPDLTNIREIRYVKWPDEGQKAEPLTILQSTSHVLRFDRAISRVAVSNTNVCDVTTLSGQEILIYCPVGGRINLMVWDMNYQTALYDIQSIVDIHKLQEIILSIDPQAVMSIVPYASTVAVTGEAATIEKVRKIQEAIKSFNDKAVTYIKVKDPKQIMLEVRFAEIDRRASKEYGLDAETISRWFNTRSFTGQAHSGEATDQQVDVFTPAGAARGIYPLLGPDPDLANEFFEFTNDNYSLKGYLRWLETKNILKLTARPNLVALDGQKASFVVGGETPYITSSFSGANVTFKEFGTKVIFTPRILDNGHIRLSVNTEVSELDFSTTVSLEGTTVPSVVKTTHQTVAELESNQTLVIGGLVNQRINRIEKKVPFLGSIKFIGQLFNREEFERKDIELLIVITPRIITPFESLGEKELYNPEKVTDATSVYKPAYPDLQADMINRLIIQDERYHEFDGFPLKRAKEIEKEFEEIRKRETAMETVLRKLTGIKIQEEATPFVLPSVSNEPSAASVSSGN